MEIRSLVRACTHFISRNCPSPEALAAMGSQSGLHRGLSPCIVDPRFTSVHREILFPPGHCIRIMNLVKLSRSSNLMMPNRRMPRYTNRGKATRHVTRATDSSRAHYRTSIKSMARSRWYLREYSSGKFFDRIRCFKLPPDDNAKWNAIFCPESDCINIFDRG